MSVPIHGLIRASLVLALLGCSGSSDAPPAPAPVPVAPEPVAPEPPPPAPPPAPPVVLDLAPLPLIITVPAGGTRVPNPDMPTGSTVEFQCGGDTAVVTIIELTSDPPRTPQFLVQHERDRGALLENVELLDDEFFYQRESEVQRGLFFDERSFVCRGYSHDGSTCVREACRTLRSTLLPSEPSLDAAAAPVVRHCVRDRLECEEHRAAHLARYGGEALPQSECTVSHGTWAEGACPTQPYDRLAVGRCISADGLLETVQYDSTPEGGPTVATLQEICLTLPGRRWLAASSRRARP